LQSLRLLPIDAQLIAALREQQVTRYDPLIFLLHLGDLRLVRRRLGPGLLQLLGLLFVGPADTQAASIRAVSGMTDAAAANLPIIMVGFPKGGTQPAPAPR
jgi:hypothetical protein